MKKLFTLIVSFLLFGLNTYAQENKVLDLTTMPSPSENTTWVMSDDNQSAIFAWTTQWYNSTQLFGAEDYTQYQSLRIVSEEGTVNHFRLIVKFSDGTEQNTINPVNVGEQTYSIEYLARGDESKISKISEIRLSGANDVTGNVKIKKVELVAGLGSVKLLPLGLTDLKTLTGTATDWASTVTYPKDFESQKLCFGNGDGGSESTHVTISGYESISFVVSKVTNGGTALRVLLWNGAVTTLYPYPADQYETADFTKPYIITKPGVYTVKVAGYPYLKGVKSSNSWEIGNVAGVVTVDYAYVTKNGQTGVAKAIDGFRHFSSNKALDFTNMKHVEAYIVPDAHDGKVYMKKVEGTVPANTGLILKSDSDAVTITIPVVKTSDAELTNILVPVSEAKTVDVPEKGNNYLYDGTKWVAVSAPTAVPAGSCYLPVNSSLVSLTVTDSPISVGDSGFIEVEGSPYDPDKAPEGGIESATRPDHGLVDAPSDTTENNQQNGTATGINSAEAGSEIVSIVTANGARVNTLQKGINIVTYSNGKRVKVIK